VSRVKVFAGKAAGGFAVAKQIVSSSLTNAGTPFRSEVSHQDRTSDSQPDPA
jgi:hypothetical protein